MKRIMRVLKDEGIATGVSQAKLQVILEELKGMSHTLTKERALYYLFAASKGFSFYKVEEIGRGLNQNKLKSLGIYLKNLEIAYYEGDKKLKCSLSSNWVAEQLSLNKKSLIDEEIINYFNPDWDVESLFMDDFEKKRYQLQIFEREAEIHLQKRDVLRKMLNAFQYEIDMELDKRAATSNL